MTSKIYYTERERNTDTFSYSEQCEQKQIALVSPCPSYALKNVASHDHKHDAGLGALTDNLLVCC